VSSSTEYAEAPALGVDGRGDQVVAWMDYRVNGFAEFAVMTASRAAGRHGWSSPQRISAWDEEGTGPVLAVSSSGAAVLAWTSAVRVRSGRLVSVIEATTRASAGAAWRLPVRLATSMVGSPVVGIDHRGDVTAAWSFYRPSGSWVLYATASAASGVWAQPRVLSRQDGENVELAVNDRDETLLSWQRRVGETSVPHALPIIHYEQIAQFRSTRGRWQPPVVVARYSQGQASPGGNIWAPSTPDLALDARGGATLMWVSNPGAWVTHRSAGAANWAPAHLIAAHPIGPVLGTDAGGAVTVAWSTRNGRLLTTTSNDGLSWSTPTVVPHATNIFTTWLSVGAGGNAILTWSGPGDRVLVSTRHDSSPGWTPPAAVGEGGFPQAGIDRAGTAAIVWPRVRSPRAFAAVIEATTYPVR
jgi:hypothetical protein